ncbi:MAG TPA: glycogen phosphorylase, partial [Opitutae bacterium]|nr:glycogen phosphorylase [Opitutae bacterium]
MTTTAKKKAKPATKKTAANSASASKASEPSFRFSTATSTDSIKTSILNHLRFTLARHPEKASQDEWWTATCYAVRDRVLDRFMKTQAVHNEKKVRRA